MSREPICRHVRDVEPVACPCGYSRRILTAADGVAIGFHVTELCDAQAHFHERATEVYYLLAGTGRLVISGSAWEVRPGSVAYLPPGCLHHGEGRLTAAIAVLPPFDPADEFSPAERLPRPCRAPIVRHVDDVEPVRSTCGVNRCVLSRDDGVALDLHVVHITAARCHYHARTTQIYHIVAGEGSFAIGRERFDLSPGVTVYVPPGVEHGGDGDFTAIVICAPPFDPEDQIVV